MKTSSLNESISLPASTVDNMDVTYFSELIIKLYKDKTICYSGNGS